MIIHCSALIAILRDEPEAGRLAAAIEEAPVRRMSAASYVGAELLVGANPVARKRLEDFISAANILIEPVTEAQARIASEAYEVFGRDSGHQACLSFGDCFDYSLWKEKREPLLFKRSDLLLTHVEDFLYTDVDRAKF